MYTRKNQKGDMKRNINRDDIRFKSTSTAPNCFFSNFYGGAEILYMAKKIENPKVKLLIESWKDITDPEEMNEIRHQLERCRVDRDGQIVPKGGKSGQAYTSKQKATYCREYNGETYLASGILAKLAAATWHPKNHRDRIGVLKMLAGTTDSLGNTVPNPEDMWEPLREKYSKEPYKRLLRATEDSRLAEMDGRKPNEWTDTGGNMLGNMLMEIREG